MPPPHPVSRLAAIVTGLRAFAAEIEDIDGEAPANILYWASEIEEAIAELRERQLVAGGATSDV